MNTPVFDCFLTVPEVAKLFSETAILQAMFDFEAALARAQAAEGLIPPEHAQSIAGVCRAELYDLRAIMVASGRAGSLAIPLVQELAKTVALFNQDAATWVHWGSTSQDVIDTAMVLATRGALAVLDAELATLVVQLLNLAELHAHTPVLARTLMQPALVTGFGLKCVNWAAPLVRSRERLREVAARALALQLGGAIGTLGRMGESGPAVARRMAEALQLRVPAAAWHTQRDEWVRLGMELAVCTGSLAKLATDLALMSQAEVGELAEPWSAGRGASSAMPHKRNPVGAMVALAASHRVPHRAAALLGCMAQEHERGLGNWQAELAEWPGLVCSAHAAAHAMAQVFDGLQVNAPRMRLNIDAQQGLVFAEAASMLLAGTLGQVPAQALLDRLLPRVIEEGVSLQDLVTEAVTGANIPPDALHDVFDPLVAVRPAAALAGMQVPALRAALGALMPAPWA